MLQPAVTAAIKQHLAEREQQDRYRHLQTVNPVSPRQLSVAGALYLNFSSNDYLGLSHHPQVLAEFSQARSAGSRSSALVTGYTGEHAELCALLQDILERPRVLLFSSAFAANTGLLGTLGRHYHQIFLDRLAHASLLQGAKQSGQSWRRFQHNNYVLAQKWMNQQQKSCLLVTESVFSMDGDEASLAALAELHAQCPQADIMIDDAHGFGVVGTDGRSVAGHFTTTSLPLISLAFGKATGVAGGALALDALSADYLLNYCPELIYSTAMPPVQAAAIRRAVTLMFGAEGHELRVRLGENIAHFRASCQAAGLKLGRSEHAIQTLHVGDDLTALQLSAQLRERGIWCNAIRPPTVPEGKARLRITLTAAHRIGDIDKLVLALQRSAEELQL